MQSGRIMCKFQINDECTFYLDSIHHTILNSSLSGYSCISFFISAFSTKIFKLLAPLFDILKSVRQKLIFMLFPSNNTTSILVSHTEHVAPWWRGVVGIVLYTVSFGRVWGFKISQRNYISVQVRSTDDTRDVSTDLGFLSSSPNDFVDFLREVTATMSPRVGLPQIIDKGWTMKRLGLVVSYAVGMSTTARNRSLYLVTVSSTEYESLLYIYIRIKVWCNVVVSRIRVMIK